ncbi:MAG: L,D-transpeptidase, partial [Solirubrobacteraceae bacterium]
FSCSAAEPRRRRAAPGKAAVCWVSRRTSDTDERTVDARTVEVKPKVTEEEIFDKQPSAVTVSRDQRRVRLFKRGNLVKTYTVAVGSEEYPSPTGHFSVQTKQVNPAWNVPNSSWAGSLAGQTIPGGAPNNPLVARWIGFAGAVGFHGTSNSGSLGSAASHGCVRMKPDDVIDLFERVSIGTSVLVA